MAYIVFILGLASPLSASWYPSAPPASAVAGTSVTVGGNITNPYVTGQPTNPYQVAFLIAWWRTPDGTQYGQIIQGGASSSLQASISIPLNSTTAKTGPVVGTWNFAVTITNQQPTNYNTIVGSGGLSANTLVTTPITAATIASLPYNGSYQAPTSVSSVSPAGATVSVSATQQKDAGTYSATVTGASPYTGSVSASWQITAIGQSVSFPNPGNQTCGGSVALSATASSGLPVTYSNVSGASISGNVLTFDQGPGTVSVTANQTGNVDYTAAPPQTISFQAVGTPTTFSLSATSFTYNGNPQGPGTPIASPSNATFNTTGTTSAIHPGTYSVTATAYGTFVGSQVLQWTITPAPQSVTFPNPGNQYTTSIVTLSATASSGLPVTFSIQSGPGSASGNTLTFSAAGSVVVRAYQAGNQDYQASYQDDTINVSALIPATYTLAQSALHYTGSTLTPTIVPSPAGATTYTVTGTSSATAIGSYTMTVQATGSYTGTSVLNWSIASGTQTISFTNPGTPKTYGDVLTLTASATSGLPVSFRMDSGTGTFSGAQLNILTLTSAGSSTVTAYQNGNINYASAASVSYPITVSKATPVGTFSARTLSPANGASGYIVTATDLNATFAHPSNGSVTAPTGTISYTIGTGSPNGTVGSTVVAGTILTLGTYYIQANYPGDSNYNTASKLATWTIDVAASIASQLHLTHPSTPPQNDSANSTALSVHKP